MKDKFVTYEERPLNNKSACDVCTKRKEGYKGFFSCSKKNKCGGGYYVKASKPRPSKHERLLMAFLKCGCVLDSIAIANSSGSITSNEYRQIIKIKESMK